MFEFEGRNVFLVGALQIATIVAINLAAIGFIYLLKPMGVTLAENLTRAVHAYWLLTVPLLWCTVAGGLLTIKTSRIRTQLAIILTGYVIWGLLVVGLVVTCAYGLRPILSLHWYGV